MNLNGTIDIDNFFGGNGNNILDGSIGNDTVIGGNGNNILDGSIGNDTVIGGNHDDSLEGGSGDDLINGGNHDDVLQGGSGDDSINGGNHNDVLQGGSGNDYLNGDIGQDSLTGGDGADRFVVDSLDSLDIIVDFDSAQGDKILVDTVATGIEQITDITVLVGSGYDDTYEMRRVTSLYFEGERIIDFDDLVSLQVEDFEFI